MLLSVFQNPSIILISFLLFAGCQNKPAQEAHEPVSEPVVTQTVTDSSGSHAQAVVETTPAKVKVLLDIYLDIKNALIDNDDKKAARAGKALSAAFAQFNSADLSEAEKKEYNEIAPNAAEQAEHIGDNKGNIKHQRFHLKDLSEDMNDLVRLLGTDRVLYRDYCAQTKSMWLSEFKEIKNPYSGSVQVPCGVLQETIEIPKPVNESSAANQN